jgi:hypothetical protein
MQLKLKNEQITQDLVGETFEFPKYTTQIINLACQNSQGTRPRIVGQMSELIEECPKGTYEEWVKWYSERMPHAVDDATEKVYGMIQNLAEAFKVIDKELVRKWAKDLIITKTFTGFRFQQSILMAIAEKKSAHYRRATPQEESKNIDGYIGNIPVQVKPITFKTKNMVPGNIDVQIIYYEKKKDGILVEYNF